MANFRQTPNSQPSKVNIVEGSSFGVAPKISSSMTMNMFITDDWLFSFPGYKKRIEPTFVGRGRGIFHSTRSNVVVQVIGAKVSVIDITLGVTQVIGALGSQIGEVYMDENLNSQVCIVDGINMYILNLTRPYSLTLQTDMSGPLSTGDLVPNYVRFHDSFFLIGNNNPTSSGAKWYAYSATVGNPLTITMTTQLQLQTKPDFALAIIPIPSAANNVLVIGSTVCEVQQNIGGTQNYRRDQSVNVDFGCLSVATIASSDKFIVWLGVNAVNGPVIMVFAGNSAEPISTNGISNLLSHIKYPAQSTACFRRIAGHLVYQLTFFNKADNLSLIFDFETKQFFHISDPFQNSHPAVDYVYFGLKTYFQSFKNGSFYESSIDITYIDENVTDTLDTDYDPTLLYQIPRYRVCDSITQADSGRFRANSFVFSMEQGNDPGFTELDLFARIPNLLVTEDNFVPSNDPIITENGQYMISETPNVVPPVTPAGELAAYLPPTNVGYVPRVDCSISNDSGVTFGNICSKNLNPLAHRKNIITFESMGSSNDLTIRLQWCSFASVTVSNGIVQIY